MGMRRRVLAALRMQKWNKYYATYTAAGGSSHWETGGWSAEAGRPNNAKSGYNDYDYPANYYTGRFARLGTIITAGLVREEPYPGDYQYVWYNGTIFLWFNDDRTIQKWRFVQEGSLRRAYMSERSSYEVGTPGVWTYAVGSYIGQFKERHGGQYPDVNVAANGHIYSGEATIGGVYYVFYRHTDGTYRAYTKA